MHSDRTILERLSKARVSDDLSHSERLCDVDCCGAAGAAAVGHRVGSALTDLDLTLARASVGKALQEAMIVTRAVAEKRGWMMTPIKLRRIATQALRQYLHAACEPCKGRGMLGVEMDKPGEYRPHVCPTCGGTGKRPMPHKNARETREVLAVLERARREFGGRVRRKLAVSGDVE